MFRLAEKSEFPLLVETLTQSFNDDPVINWTLRKDEHRVEALRDYMEFHLDWFYPAGGVYTSEEGKACSIWVPYGFKGRTFTDEERRQYIERKTRWTTLDGLWKFDLFVKLEKEKEPLYNHMHLGFIGVRPELQGKGIGSDLLKHMLTRLDETSLPAYLESSNSRNDLFYERHGFRVIDSITLPDGPTIQCMLRKPQNTTVTREARVINDVNRGGYVRND